MTQPEASPPGGMAAHMLDFEIGEAFHALRALILAKADHEISRVNQALREAGIDHPQNSAGVRDLAMIVKTYPDAIADAMREELEDEGKRHGLTNGVGSPFYRGMEFMIQFVENYGNEE